VDEADIGRVRAAMPVEFTVETYGQAKFFGEVSAVRMNATNQNNVVTYPVWIKVENQDLRLRPSLTATAKIIISRATNVVRIPNQAFRFRPNADIYTALGLEPPAAGRGRRLGGAGDDKETNGGGKAGTPPAGATGQPAAGQPAAGQPGQPDASKQAQAGRGGQGGQSGGGQTRTPGSGGTQGARTDRGDRTGKSGQGFGAQSGMPNLTPEQMQAMRERFARGGGGGSGRGGGGTGRAGGQAGQNGQNQGGRGGGGGRNAQAGPPVEVKEGQKIDDFFQPVPRLISRNSVWTYTEGQNGQPGVLKEFNVQLGVTDGTFSELVSGDVKVGDQLVTSVTLPRPAAPTMGANPFGQPQRGGGPGGFTPAGPGGGGGGNPGGGGGRGGGGRGGN
jgi:hypothetical protein